MAEVCLKPVYKKSLGTDTNKSGTLYAVVYCALSPHFYTPSPYIDLHPVLNSELDPEEEGKAKTHLKKISQAMTDCINDTLKDTQKGASKVFRLLTKAERSGRTASLVEDWKKQLTSRVTVSEPLQSFDHKVSVVLMNYSEWTVQTERFEADERIKQKSSGKAHNSEWGAGRMNFNSDIAEQSSRNQSRGFSADEEATK